MQRACLAKFWSAEVTELASHLASHEPGQAWSGVCGVWASGNGVVRPGRLTCNTGLSSALRDNTTVAARLHQRSLARLQALPRLPALTTSGFLANIQRTHSECCVGSVWGRETATIVTRAKTEHCDTRDSSTLVIRIFPFVIFIRNSPEWFFPNCESSEFLTLTSKWYFATLARSWSLGLSWVQVSDCFPPWQCVARPV